jgi:hypothetical protein
MYIENGFSIGLIIVARHGEEQSNKTRREFKKKRVDSSMNQQEFKKKNEESEENQGRFMKNPWRIEEDDEESCCN